MEKCVKKDYSIGLDIGTESVGWAAIDAKTFKVIRKGNQKLWGVRLFDSAETAEERRGYRSTRRRYDRRRVRIKLLQEVFKEEMNKVDVDFFKKLKESAYLEEDTTVSKFSREKKDNYRKIYPTIYHLRYKLMNTYEKMDIRLVYMAIHHIIKYRGNFLYEAKKLDLSNLDIKEPLENMLNELNNTTSIVKKVGVSISLEKLEKAFNESSKSDKKKKLTDEFSLLFSKKVSDGLAKLLLGDSVKLNDLFNTNYESEVKISFKGDEYENNEEDISKLFSDEIELLESIKKVYDVLFLKNIFKNKQEASISFAMVDNYYVHRNDLKLLKKVLRNDKDSYSNMFIEANDNKKEKYNRPLYIKYITNNITYEDFKKAILKSLEKIDSQEKEMIIERLNSEEFMPRITSTDNGKYPYQLNESELKKIIEKQGKFYPFLLDKINGEYKLVKILAFRIPYYVGPLNDTTDKSNVKNKNSWLVKKQDYKKITPYNFDEVVDLEASAEKFIKRMLGTCTYLLREPSMPANSILYSKFKVLNELKQIRVGEENKELRLTREMINKIYGELFLVSEGTITDKKFKEYLMSTGEFSMYNNLSVTGYSADKKFANNMSSYITFWKDVGILSNTEYTMDDAEKIIEYVTIFEDKKILEKKLKNDFTKLSDDKIKQICNLKYKGWSRLSKRLLTDIYYVNPKTNEAKNIISLMEETNANFMQILNDKKYNFEEKIREINNSQIENKLSYSLVDELATSPRNKRGIYQALKIIKEIIQYMGYEPKRITFEMARGDAKKVRSVDRKKYIEDLYKVSKEDIKNYVQLKRELDTYDKIENYNQKLFLYFLQEGKSLYSGCSLDIDKLEQYEIDHIIPRTLIKDNSVDNLALVTREENQQKASSFVLPEKFRSAYRIKWWNQLKKHGLMSDKKYYNLIRNKFDDKQIEGFINRQLVETRQICKHVANIVNHMYQDVEVYYIPAKLSSDYREKFSLYKFREINNYHHAYDAYLAAALGEYRKYLKSNIGYDYLKRINYQAFQEKKYQELNAGYVINSLINTENFLELFTDFDTGELLFDANKFNKTIHDTLYCNDVIVTKKSDFKSGELWQQTKEKKGNLGVPLKENMPTEKYGAYTSIKPAYIVLVNYIKKSKEKRRLVVIPVYIDIVSKNDVTKKLEYLKKLLEAEKVEIIRDRIPFNTFLIWNGAICSLVGGSKDKVEICNAKEFRIDKSHMQKWQQTFIRLFYDKNVIEDSLYDKELDEIIDYIISKVEKEYVLYQNLVPKMNDKFKRSLTIELKEKIITEMFKLLKNNSVTANLKFLGESSEFGRASSKNIDYFTLVNYSSTGLYYKVESWDK